MITIPENWATTNDFMSTTRWTIYFSHHHRSILANRTLQTETQDPHYVCRVWNTWTNDYYSWELGDHQRPDVHHRVDDPLQPAIATTPTDTNNYSPVANHRLTESTSTRQRGAPTPQIHPRKPAHTNGDPGSTLCLQSLKHLNISISAN
jgi:hypothetical protein